jgi:hypothetical protein
MSETIKNRTTRNSGIFTSLNTASLNASAAFRRLDARAGFARLGNSRRTLALSAGLFTVGYAFAWFSHFFVEHNKPATFKYPSGRSFPIIKWFLYAHRRMNAELSSKINKIVPNTQNKRYKKDSAIENKKRN